MSEISLIGTSFAFLIAFGQLVLTRRTFRNYVAFMLFFNVGCLLANSWLFFSGLVLEYPVLINLYLPFFYLIAPFLHIFYRMVQEKDFRFTKHLAVHFIPAVIAVAVMLPYYFSDPERKTAEFRRLTMTLELDQSAILFFAGSLILFCYIVFLIYRLRFFMKPQYLKNEAAPVVLISVAFSGLIAISFLSLTFIVRDLIFLKLASGSLSLIVIYLNLVNKRYPELFQQLQMIAADEKYSRSLIEDLDLEDLRAKLDHLMEAEKAYCREDLSLAGLAESLGISAHQLSQYLNERIGKNFASYVNGFRIDDAAHQLEKNRELTILHIAYTVGFNSKSAFNKAFKQKNGITPSEYRRRFQKG